MRAVKWEVESVHNKNVVGTTNLLRSVGAKKKGKRKDHVKKSGA